jgi:hypothetical protein
MHVPQNGINVMPLSYLLSQTWQAGSEQCVCGGITEYICGRYSPLYLAYLSNKPTSVLGT